MELKRNQKDRGFGYKKAIQYPTEKELEEKNKCKPLLYSELNNLKK
tara:strand:+ start:1299 stop:1436 length:138 start_codon:yes stop_codon:yes gene_type:complete